MPSQVEDVDVDAFYLLSYCRCLFDGMLLYARNPFSQQRSQAKRRLAKSRVKRCRDAT
jgi:hypothetical protein